MRVTFIVPKFNLPGGGGSNHNLHLTALGLGQLGHEVKVIHLSDEAYGAPPKAPYQVVRANTLLKHVSRDKQHPAKAAYELLKQCSDETDIFHLYGAFLSLPGGIYKFLGGKAPVVVTLDNYELFCTHIADIKDYCYRSCGIKERLRAEPTFLKKAFRLPIYLFKYGKTGFFLANKVDQFLPVSQAVRQIYSDAGLNMHKSTIIYPAIDYQSICGRVARFAEKKVNKTDGMPHYLLCIARLDYEKGMDILIKALSLIDSPVHLHVVGDGPQHSFLLKQVRDLRLENKVTFHGWKTKDKLEGFYKEAHLFIHPARWPEPCSMAVIEAMAYSVPAIVSNTGGSPCILGDSGLTFRTEDAEDLADKIRWCCAHYKEVSLLAHKAKNQAAECDYRQAAFKLQEVYKKLVH